MELTKVNGFTDLSVNEMEMIDGGFITIPTGPVILGQIIARYILKNWF